MRRDSEFDKTKLYSISTKDTVLDVYADSFQIEKVRITLSEFSGNKNRINLYIDFADFLRIAKQVDNKDIFKNIKKTGKPEDLYYGGYKKDDAVTSTKLQLNMSDSGKIFFNAFSGPGKVTSTGAYVPAGDYNVKISVSTDYNKCLAMFMYVELAIKSFLPKFFRELCENKS